MSSTYSDPTSSSAPAIYSRQLGNTAAPPLLVIHGLFGSLDNLGLIARRLSDTYCVYSIDLPNHGRSAHTQTTSLALLAESVVAWMSEQGIEKAHVLGHSLGGKVGMEIALRYPEKVDRLVVADIAPVAYTARHNDVFAAFKAVDLTVINNRIDADKMMQPCVGELSTRSFLLKNLEKTKDGAWYWRANIDGLIAAYEQLIDANSQDLTAFTRPVLFIKGELSPYILPEHRESIVSLFPFASVKIISGTRHWLHAEKPDIFVGIVRRFLSLG
ncbi:MAG: esterase [Candidatus Endobugula sp.]|jgi:esterase